MADSTSMTIEFLRARLLSERSVSRTARQRADQLAKRVTELEEQLRIIVIQRKKAERAAAEVLDILENEGVGDFAEAIDSSSDRDDVEEGSMGNDGKEAGDSMISTMDKRMGEDGLSSSEHEASPSQGRSLSWKGRADSPNSRERHKIKQIRHSSFSSDIQSSGKHQPGKSCRKIGRRETRSVEDDEVGNALLGVHKDGGASQSNHSDDLPDINKEPSTLVEESSCHHDEQIKETGPGHYAKQTDNGEEMERVLEQQARLIVQFQAEENAQREWEEKYNESKSSNLDFCEPEDQPGKSKKHGDVEDAAQNHYYAEGAKTRAENETNMEQLSAQCLLSASAPIVQNHAVKQEMDDYNKELSAHGLSNDFIQTDTDKIGKSSAQALSKDMSLQQYYNITVQDTEAISQEFAFPCQEFSNISTHGKKNQRISYGNTEIGPHSNSSLHPNGDGFLESPSSGSLSSFNSHSKVSKWRSSGMQNQLPRMLPQSSNNRLGGVLKALQHAKTSLEQLSGLPLPNQGTLSTIASTDTHVRTMKNGGGLGISVCTPGLFRLPMDPFLRESFSMPKSYGSELSLKTSQPDIGYATTCNGYQYPTPSFLESVSALSAGRQHFDPYSNPNRGMSASSEYSPHMDLTTERNRLQDGFSRSGMDVRSKMSSGYQYSLYGGSGLLPDMHRL